VWMRVLVRRGGGRVELCNDDLVSFCAVLCCAFGAWEVCGFERADLTCLVVARYEDEKGMNDFMRYGLGSHEETKSNMKEDA
jgi:hypothetical protein